MLRERLWLFQNNIQNVVGVAIAGNVDDVFLCLGWIPRNHQEVTTRNIRCHRVSGNVENSHLQVHDWVMVALDDDTSTFVGPKSLAIFEVPASIQSDFGIDTILTAHW